uniref:Putative restriction alleviation protein n=1 Tax=viral metagenome TaxID=1070528 RepID=A0A6M3IHR0_9ZZZZ
MKKEDIIKIAEPLISEGILEGQSDYDIAYNIAKMIIEQKKANPVENRVSQPSELLLCPFCGAECKIEQRTFGDSNIYYYRIECNGVNNHSLDCWDDTEEEAKETWNKRASP